MDMPTLPLSPDTDRSNWTQVLRDGVGGLQQRGIETAYLIAEEHLPIALCHEEHLQATLPGLLQKLDAVYISLMGWDNRRYVSKSPVLGSEFFEFKHLRGERDPRFHLHPALWRLEALKACCELTLDQPGQNGSAWSFEKTCDKANAPLPQSWKTGCYQIRASAMNTRPLGTVSRLTAFCERFFYHKLMALMPMMPPAWVSPIARRVAFDSVFCDGPYPMFYSGLMAKGGVNPYFKKFVGQRFPEVWEHVSGVAGLQ